MQKHVAIIGGGYAGLAAAVALTGNTIPVTVLESAKQLGGRARRVDHQGLKLDNGQHILLGAYHETLRMIDLVSRTEISARPPRYLRLPLELTIPGHFSLKTAPLPEPLHLVVALLSAHGLSLSERFQAVRFMLYMRRRQFMLPDDISVATLLQQHRQGGNLLRFLWEPLCIAALNTPVMTASAQIFLNVLKDSLSGARAASDMIVPQIDLSALFPDHAAAYIAHHGGVVKTGSGVDKIESTPSGFRLFAQNQSHDFTHIICAVAPQRVQQLTANFSELAEANSMIANFRYQPIYTVYLQYPPHTCLPQPMTGLSGGYSQWVFDRGQTHQTPGLLAVIISAEGDHQNLEQHALAQRVHTELKSNFTFLPEPVWHKVIAEKRATFSCSVNLQRPNQVTSLKNFYLAGDYTAGDYPATLEAAVQSGVKCANTILENI